MGPEGLELFEVDKQSWVPVQADAPRLLVPSGTYDKVKYNITDFPTPVQERFSRTYDLKSGDSLHLHLTATVLGKTFMWDLEIEVGSEPERHTVQVRFDATEINKAHFIRALDPDIQFGHVELDPFSIVVTFSEKVPQASDATHVDGFAVYVWSANCEAPPDLEQWDRLVWCAAPGMSYTVLISRERGLKALTTITGFKGQIAKAKQQARCLYDTDGDGNCPSCANLPDGCPNKPPEAVFELPKMDVKCPPIFDFARDTSISRKTMRELLKDATGL